LLRIGMRGFVGLLSEQSKDQKTTRPAGRDGARLVASY
jgi:hypothetical protein